MMQSTLRVRRFRERQEQAGRRLVSAYMANEDIELLHRLAGRQQQGQVLAKALRLLSALKESV